MAIAVATGLVALAASIWLSRQMARLRARLREQEAGLLSLRGALSALHAQAQQGEEERARLERQLRRLTEQQERMTQQVPEEGAYNHALRMVHQGAGRKELMENCGLSRGEADLLLSMHRRDTPAP
ncbi:MAG: DUF2802 domain-containing protein [Ectothiorhodospira sp.]